MVPCAGTVTSRTAYRRKSSPVKASQIESVGTSTFERSDRPGSGTGPKDETEGTHTRRRRPVPKSPPPDAGLSAPSTSLPISLAAVEAYRPMRGEAEAVTRSGSCFERTQVRQRSPSTRARRAASGGRIWTRTVVRDAGGISRRCEQGRKMMSKRESGELGSGSGAQISSRTY